MQNRKNDLFFNNPPLYTVTDLLNQAGQGNEAKVLEIIQANPQLLKQSGNFTDLAGYTFTNITFIEYVAWAWDIKYMANKVIDSLPNDEQGMELKVFLLKQLEKLNKEGINYEFLGKKITGEKRFNIQPLLDAMYTFIKNADNWPQEQQDNYCNTTIGMLQRQLTAYIRQEYCVINRPFSTENDDMEDEDDLDDENETRDVEGNEAQATGWSNTNGICTFENETIERTLQFYNQETDEGMTWDANTEGLGTVFCIGRSCVAFEAQGCGHDITTYELLDDYKALQILNSRIQSDLHNLMQKLKESTKNYEPDELNDNNNNNRLW